jgi:putative chitobiose transport system permease protein
MTSSLTLARRGAGRILFLALLLALAAIFATPFLWLVSTALKPGGTNLFVFPPQFIPQPSTLENFEYALYFFPFLRYARNSLIVAGSATILSVFTSVLAGYPLARLDFPGKNLVFYLMLATIIVPMHAILVALFKFMFDLGLRDTFVGAIIPFTVSAYGVFLMRQAFRAIPQELVDAALIDGASHWQILRRIMVPLVYPAIGAQALYAFVITWNEFLWPFLILPSQEKWTVQQGLQSQFHIFSYDFGHISASTTLAMLPIMIVFLLLQRLFIEEFVTSGLKG